MKRTISTLIKAAAVTTSTLACSTALAADKPDQVTIGYFLEWPTANQVAQVEKHYDKAMGVDVEWRAFDSGAAMSAAMASGDVDMAYSQGLVPFTVAVSQGLPITMVGIAVSYAENDNCVVGKGAGITLDNAKDLEGKSVSVPFGTVAHYKMLRVMSHLGVDSTKVRLLDMAPADGAAALMRDDVAMACGWGGALRRMKNFGEVLMSAKEQESIGIRVFDVISASNRFAEEYPEMVTKFLQVTDNANRSYATNPAPAQPIIAKASGLSLDESNQILALFDFPLKDAQLSQAWMGGTVQSFTKEVADFFVKHKQIPKALADYSATIDSSYYSNVN
ncbi:taurine ABC transporter substrate-binding protein [Motiliproteus coralliicola]|uniref:Taurine ABC transporter substrate-binding protein n=1 Tax=Motiliproteus coralliicola TaxID=2283196 RepID=A0A369WBL3_9GAMM|nr:ABC transporter substrate-binding protein [Motiliproteus coralliicola]RDE19390.1 taurine ABC transporter substrate-binding protein [Motiliproteus coralliicola]